MEGEGVLGLEPRPRSRLLECEGEGLPETVVREGDGTETETEGEGFIGFGLKMEEILGLGLERGVRGEEKTKGRETEEVETAGREGVGTRTGMEGEGATG